MMSEETSLVDRNTKFERKKAERDRYEGFMCLYNNTAGFAKGYNQVQRAMMLVAPTESVEWLSMPVAS